MRFGRSVTAIAVTGVAVLAMACGGGDGPTGEPPIVNTQGTITGRVVDADSASGGMANVTVQATGTAGSKSATTASNGTFSISALEAGSYTVQLTAPGTFVNATGEVGT